MVAGSVRLTGSLDVPTGARGLVLYSMDVDDHADWCITEWIEELRACALAILCFDLLTNCEKSREHFGGRLRFDISLLRARPALQPCVLWSARMPIPNSST